MSVPSVRDLEYALKSGADANLVKAALDAIDALSSAEAGFLDSVTAGTATASKAVVLGASKEIATITSATITTLTSTSVIQAKTIQLTKAHAKVGATAGWAIPTTTNLPYMATQAAGGTGSTLVIHLDGLQIGSTITGYKIIAQVESAGNTVTIDAALRAVTNVAAEPTDAAIGTGMTQVSVTADTAVAQEKTGHTEVVTSGKTYYILITSTTAASTDIILQNVEISYTSV